MQSAPLPGVSPPVGTNGAVSSPETPSADYAAMLDYWTMVECILDGATAMRAAGIKYLPRFPNETDADYEYRRKNAKFTNVYRDIVEGLAAKPFTKEVELVDGKASKKVEELVEDIDGQGSHLHVFAQQVFFQGINDAIDWILIDKPPVPEGASVAVEKQMGARPYWIHVPAKRMLAVHSDVVGGKETIVHCRIHEPTCVKVGYDEVILNRVREFNRDKLSDGSYGPAHFTLWEEREDSADRLKKVWVAIEQGNISIGVIAIVPFITGRRRGTSWRFVPPMQDAAFLQVEHFQQETNLKSIKEQAAFPMLAGNGVSPPVDEAGNVKVVPVGPKTVLYAPMSSEGRAGSWQFIEPAAQSLTFLAADVAATEQQLRELGRHPLTAQSSNLTVVTTLFAAQKSNSAIQAWAFNLKDALEEAFRYTCLWLGDSSQPEVAVHTDFAIDMESDKAPDFLLKLRDGKVISRKALIVEAKRRDFLSPEYDADEDEAELLKEEAALPTEQDVRDALPPGQNPNLNADGTTKQPGDPGYVEPSAPPTLQ